MITGESGDQPLAPDQLLQSLQLGHQHPVTDGVTILFVQGTEAAQLYQQKSHLLAGNSRLANIQPQPLLHQNTIQLGKGVGSGKLQHMLFQLSQGGEIGHRTDKIATVPRWCRASKCQRPPQGQQITALVQTEKLTIPTAESADLAMEFLVGFILRIVRQYRLDITPQQFILLIS